MSDHEEDNETFLAAQFGLGENLEAQPSMDEMLGISQGENVEQVQGSNADRRSTDQPTSSQVGILEHRHV